MNEDNSGQEPNIMMSIDVSRTPAGQDSRQSLQEASVMTYTAGVNTQEKHVLRETSNCCGLTSTDYTGLTAAPDVEENTFEKMSREVNQDGHCSPIVVDVNDRDASEEGTDTNNSWVEMFARSADVIDNTLGARCSTSEPSQQQVVAWLSDLGGINFDYPYNASTVFAGVDTQQNSRFVIKQGEGQTRMDDDSEAVWPPTSCIDVGDCSDATTVAAAAAAVAASVAAAVAAAKTEENEQIEPAQRQEGATQAAPDVSIQPTRPLAIGEAGDTFPLGAVHLSDSMGAELIAGKEYGFTKRDTCAAGSPEEKNDETNDEEGPEQRCTIEKVSYGAVQSSAGVRALRHAPCNRAVPEAAAGGETAAAYGQPEQSTGGGGLQDELATLAVLRSLRPPVDHLSPAGHLSPGALFLPDTPVGERTTTADNGCSTKKKRDVVGRVSNSGGPRRFSMRSRRPKLWFDERGLISPSTDSTYNRAPNECSTGSGRLPVTTAANATSTDEDDGPFPSSVRPKCSTPAGLLTHPNPSVRENDVAAGASDTITGAPETPSGRYSLRLRPRESVEATPLLAAIGASGKAAEARAPRCTPRRSPSIAGSGHFLRSSQPRNMPPRSHPHVVGATPPDGDPLSTIESRMTATSPSERNEPGRKRNRKEGSGGVATVMAAKPASSMVVARQARRCGDNNCLRRPSFGYPGDSRASWCVAHKTEGHVDVTSRRCDREGCIRIPSFRHRGEQRSRFCAAHKEPGMHDYHKDTRRCIQSPGCGRTPSFGFNGGKRISCATHKSEGMENLNTTKCQGAGCKLTPYFGLPGSAPTFCKKHTGQGMINLISHRCEDRSCRQIPSYGWESGRSKAKFCSKHRVEGMVNVRHPRCAHGDCRRQPGFGKAGGQRGVYCKEHKEAGMVDLKNNYVKKKERPKCCTQAGCQRQITSGNRERNATAYCKEHRGVDVVHAKSGSGRKKSRKG